MQGGHGGAGGGHDIVELCVSAGRVGILPLGGGADRHGAVEVGDDVDATRKELRQACGVVLEQGSLTFDAIAHGAGVGGGKGLQTCDTCGPDDVTFVW